MRTTFENVSGTPFQRIGPASQGFALLEEDLSGESEAWQSEAVLRISREEAQGRFDLARGPLIRGRLLRLSAQSHVLLVTQHRIVSDGWSIGVLVREVSALYGACRAGEPDPLPALPIQYADYAAWQRNWLQGGVLAEQIGFWVAHLKGAPALLELPTDRPRGQLQSYAGGQVPVRLSAGLTAALRGLSQRHGVTLFMTLLSGWSVLLSRLSGQQDVVVGTPVANRQRAELEGLIGFFVNTLALRSRIDGEATVAQLLAQTRAMSIDAFAHQDVPFEQVVEAVQPPRSLSHAPVFQVMLTLDNTPTGGALQLPGLTIRVDEVSLNSNRADLSLAGLAPAFPMHACRFFYHGDSFRK